jgi:DNA-binding transcriptional LysR family regulator
MELRHLRYFVAVAEHLCFRKAAQNLHVSHSSLCRQIMDLEREIGAPLFKRSHHRVELTECGHTFLAGARQTLRYALLTMEATRQTYRGHQGELRIANIGWLCPDLLAALIRAFRKRFPNVQVLILQQHNVESIQTVLERAQLCIGYLNTAPNPDPAAKTNSWVIASAPVGLVTTATFAKRRRSAGNLRDYSFEPFIMLEPKYSPGYQEWVRSIFLQSGFEPVQTVPVASAEGLFTLIRAGAGVALLSELHLQGQGEGLSFQKLNDVLHEFPLSLIWDAQQASPLVHNFVSVARQVLAKPNDVLLPADPNGSASAVLNSR